MGRIVELALPRLGETMDEGRIGTILKRPSEAFRRGDTLLEVESDKTTVEVPALQDGILVEWLVAADQQVAVGAAIARIEIEGEAIGEVARPPATPAPPPPPRSSPAPRRAAPPPVAAGRPRASTAARVAARRAGIDLAAIAGTGRNGRTTKDDIAIALRPSRTTRRIATLDGEVHVREWAPAGRPRAQALLLHGLFSDSQSFTSLGRKLAVEGVRAQAPDLPGHGESSSAAADPAAIAAAVRSCLPADKVHIVAHSFGAVVAAALLDRALSLTLLALAGCGEEISQAFLDAMIAGRIDHAVALLGETIPPEAHLY